MGQPTVVDLLSEMTKASEALLKVLADHKEWELTQDLWTAVDKARAFLQVAESRDPKPPLILRKFAGAGVKTMKDHERLELQHEKIKRVMGDGQFRTLHEIEEITGYPPASISAQLRHLRKVGFGSHKVERRLRGPGTGLHEYRLTLNWQQTDIFGRKEAWIKGA